MFRNLKRKFFLLVSITTFLILLLVFLILNLTMKVTTENNLKNQFAMIQERLDEPHRPDGPHEGGFPPRYILVTLDGDEISSISSSEGFPLDENKIKEMTAQVIRKEKGFDRIECYYYSFENSRILYLDATADINSMKNTLMISLIICSSSFLLISLFAFLISSMVIKPYERLYQKEKTFITDASHELKTPLSIIQTNNEILKETYPNDRWVDSNLVQTKRMGKLIHDLISLSKLEELKGRISKEDFCLSDLLLDAIVPYEGVFQKKGIQVKEDVTDDIHYVGNEESIMKLFQVMTDNALKYTSPNGTLKVSLKEEKKAVLILFENSTTLKEGTDLSNIFDRFASLDPSRSRDSSGFGIGLSIAKTIVDCHEGKISASIKDGMIHFEIRLKKITAKAS